MKPTNYDIKDIEKLTKINEETAREFLDASVPIVIRTDKRNFQRAEKESDLEQAKRLREMGIYEMLQYFLE